MAYTVIGDINQDNTETGTITRNEILTTGGKTKDRYINYNNKDRYQKSKFENLKKSSYGNRSNNQDTS